MNVRYSRNPVPLAATSNFRVKLTRYLYLFFVFLSCKQKVAQPSAVEKSLITKTSESVPMLSKHDISGEWYWSTEEREFTLYINQRGDSILGTYCAIAQNGNRVDCDDVNNPTYCIVQGRFHGDSAILLYNSAYSDEAERDTAIIKYNSKDSSLLWRTEKRNILSYVPMQAILKR
jgi:hypothetical protein